MGKEMAAKIELSETYPETLRLKTKIPEENRVGRGIIKLKTPNPVATPLPPLNLRKTE